MTPAAAALQFEVAAAVVGVDDAGAAGVGAGAGRPSLEIQGSVSVVGVVTPATLPGHPLPRPLVGGGPTLQVVLVAAVHSPSPVGGGGDGGCGSARRR